MIGVGVVSRSFPDLTNAEIARFMADNGFVSTELCFKSADADFWVYNGRSDLSPMTDRRAREIVGTYRDAGIEVASLGVFTNLIEPDAAEREANLAYFRRMIEIAADNAIPVVATETGFHPDARGVRASVFEEDFARLVESFRSLCELGDEYDVDVALEPSVIDIVPSAKRARDFIREVGSPRAKILLDPANLIANSTEEEMFEHLAPHIAYLHGKDRRVNDAKGRIVGDGEIDWPRFLSLYHRHAEGKPFILEYVNSENAAMVRERVLAYESAAVGAAAESTTKEKT
jgi:sugar phosphate isomerase/epimerase